MFRKIASTSLTFVLGAAALAAATVALPGQASAYEGRYERSYERAYGDDWRPAPPRFHGYWGQRRWERRYEGYGFRAPPPPPAYWYSWR